MMNARVLLNVVLGALALGACDEDPAFFHECPLSDTILELCAEQSDDTQLTCIVREHPMCEESICASWKGSASFCSRECTDDAGCPTDSTCQTYLDFKVCVPNTPPAATVAQ